MIKAVPGQSKKLVLGAIVLLCLGVAIWQIRSQASVIRALPAHMAMAMHLKGLDALQTLPEPVQNTLGQLSPIQILKADLQIAHEVIGRYPAFKNLWKSESFAAAWSLLPADSLHPVVSVCLPTKIDLPFFLDSLPDGYRVFPTQFRGHTLFTVYNPVREKIVLASCRGLLIYSRFSYLVEDALSELDRYVINASLRPPGNGAQRAPAALWIHTGEAVSWLAGSFAPAWQGLPGNAAGIFPDIGFVFDAEGTQFIVETSGFWAEASALINPPSGDLYQVLPNHTAVVAYAGIGHLQRFFSGKAPSGYQNFDRFIVPWLGKEVAWVITEPLTENWSEEQFLVLEAADTAVARRQLLAYGRESGFLRSPELYQTFEIFEFFNADALMPVTGHTAAFQKPVAALLGRYVLIGQNRAALELWIDKYIVSQTLAADPAFLQLLDKNRPGAWVYLNSSFLPAICKTISRGGGRESDIQAISTLGRLAFSVFNAKNSVKGRIFSQTDIQSTGNEVNIQWKTPLAADALGAPAVVALKSKTESVVFIQDKRFELYCLDVNGEVRWRRQLPGPIFGQVQGLDVLGNGSTNFLFNTANAIWMLDEQGQNFEHFPIVLQSPATNGVTLVDFDGQRSYAFFIACANNNAYGYDTFGRPLPGWNPLPDIGRVVHPFLHFQSDHKDYLTLLNQRGILRAFSRSGESRFASVNMGTSVVGPPQVDLAGANPRIVCFDGAGKALVCNLSGETFSLAVSGRRTPAQGVLSPLTGDARCEYAVLQDSVLSVGGYQGNTFKNLFKIALPPGQDTIFNTSGNRLGILNRTTRQIWLLDSKGVVVKGFPLAGTTAFVLNHDLHKTHSEMLFVAHGATVYAYRID